VSYDVLALRRREFPWADRGDVVYLNHAGTGPLPERAVAAHAEWARLRAEPWRITFEMQFGTLARSRELCARLVGAGPDEIALMVNTSYGLNLAARALPLREGDVVLSFDREFPANVYPWMALARTAGVRFEQLPVRDGVPDEEALLAALDRPRVRAVSVSWVSFSSGYQLDLARIGRACRERGIYFVVDAIQGVGVSELDVRACSVDVLACGAQKWLLAPWGAGFTYVRRELVRALEPADVGWMSVRDSDDFTRLCDYDLTYRDDARRFEVITLPYQDFAALNESLELIVGLGVDAIATHLASLTGLVAEWAEARGVRATPPAGRRAGIIAVVPPGDPAEASERLTSAGVVHSLREGAIRLSPHCYNTREEIERALEVLGGVAAGAGAGAGAALRSRG